VTGAKKWSKKMPPIEIERPFDSIESAQDFMAVLASIILDEMKDLKRDHEIALREREERRGQAIELALFKLKTLSCHIHKSRRALNDLRMLRRLILNERLTVEHLLATM
jgi:hypothetical protein